MLHVNCIIQFVPSYSSIKFIVSINIFELIVYVLWKPSQELIVFIQKGILFRFLFFSSHIFRFDLFVLLALIVGFWYRVRCSLVECFY